MVRCQNNLPLKFMFYYQKKVDLPSQFLVIIELKKLKEQLQKCSMSYYKYSEIEHSNNQSKDNKTEYRNKCRCM